MPVYRKRFRIEETILGCKPMDNTPDTNEPPMHREIMRELRAIREQMAHPQRSGGVTQDSVAMPSETENAQPLLESYRAQILQCEKLKIELDLIHHAIHRTKQEIAVLHGKSFNGAEMAKASGELDAVVGGTEAATQQILEAAEIIDQAASALNEVTFPDQRRQLVEEIGDRVVSIFEACNFQDLTGQRITKVMTAMKLIERHVGVMMDIWGGVDAIRIHASGGEQRSADASLLNGPGSKGDAGHASQNDIDAMFD